MFHEKGSAEDARHEGEVKADDRDFNAVLFRRRGIDFFDGRGFGLLDFDGGDGRVGFGVAGALNDCWTASRG